ncbi:MAG: zinc ribbon domain-containing protein [Chloroflexi bacterium]|nr:zinc ribbon domain-containing protein [Chloroflexota bacterium]
MPKYQYACPTCEVEFEIKRSFAECDQPAHCPDCGGVAARRPTLFGYVKGGASAPKPAAQTQKVHAMGCPCCSAAPRPKAPTA